METKKIIWIGAVFILIILLGTIFIYSFKGKLSEENNSSISNTTANFSSGSNFSVSLGKSPDWCLTGQAWNNKKVNSTQLLIKRSFSNVNNETVCSVISKDMTIRYAFNKDESHIYNITFTNVTTLVVPSNLSSNGSRMPPNLGSNISVGIPHYELIS